jgi:hypothetical protein
MCNTNSRERSAREENRRLDKDMDMDIEVKTNVLHIYNVCTKEYYYWTKNVFGRLFEYSFCGLVFLMRVCRRNEYIE